MRRFGLAALLTLALLPSGCNALRWSNEASEVAYQQVRPKVLLERYERFKEQRAVLDAKQASIAQYQAAIHSLKSDYAGTPMVDWPMDAREGYAARRAELHGMVASYNLLAADYNAAMSKENYRFCNVGRLPQGLEGMEPLPRQYAPYLTQ